METFKTFMEDEVRVIWQSKLHSMELEDLKIPSVAQLLNNFLTFYETRKLIIVFTSALSIRPYPEPDESSSCHSILFL
jgi:hypothetical protein